MHVHFVCAGNVYRSRLAEALLNRERLSGLHASSSGTIAAENLNGPVSWTALRLLKRSALIPFMSPSWTQTNPDLLAAADLVVFMEPAIHAHCVATFTFAGDAFEVWDVPDVGDPRFPEQQVAPGDDARLMAVTEATFARLQGEVAALVDRLLKGSAGKLCDHEAAGASEAAS